MKAFEIASLTVKIVAESLGQYANGEIRAPLPTQLLLMPDGDIAATLPLTTYAEELQAAVDHLRHFGVAF